MIPACPADSLLELAGQLMPCSRFCTDAMSAWLSQMTGQMAGWALSSRPLEAGAEAISDSCRLKPQQHHVCLAGGEPGCSCMGGSRTSPFLKGSAEPEGSRVWPHAACSQEAADKLMAAVVGSTAIALAAELCNCASLCRPPVLLMALTAPSQEPARSGCLG